MVEHHKMGIKPITGRLGMQNIRRVLGVTIAFFVLCTGPVFAATDEDSNQSPVDTEAMSTLMKMADFLAQAKRYSVTIESGYEVVQDTGQKIEFGSVRKLVMDRPNRIREDIEQRDGSKAEFMFNGKEVYISNTRDKVYGEIERPGDVDQAVAYFTENLGMRMPLLSSSRCILPVSSKTRFASSIMWTQPQSMESLAITSLPELIM